MTAKTTGMTVLAADELATVVALLVQARIPLLIEGDPGIGKTAICRAAGGGLGLRTTVVNCSTLVETDLGGFPYRDGPVVQLALLDWITALCGDGGIASDPIVPVADMVVLDELNAAPASTHAALLGFLFEREVARRPLRADVSIVATANPPESGVIGTDIPPPMRNRLCCLGYSPDVDTVRGVWFPDVGARASTPIVPAHWRSTHLPAWRAQVLRVLERHPSLLASFHQRDDRDRFGSPRSWDLAAHTAAAASAAGLPRSLSFKLMAGCVGESAALVAVEELVTIRFPNPEKLLTGDRSGLGDLTASELLIVGSEVVAAVARNRTEERWTAALDLLSHMATLGPVDVAAAGARSLIRDQREDGWAIPESIIAFEELAAALVPTSP